MTLKNAIGISKIIIYFSGRSVYLEKDLTTKKFFEISFSDKNASWSSAYYTQPSCFVFKWMINLFLFVFIEVFRDFFRTFFQNMEVIINIVLRHFSDKTGKRQRSNDFIVLAPYRNSDA